MYPVERRNIQNNLSGKQEGGLLRRSSVTSRNQTAATWLCGFAALLAESLWLSVSSLGS
jgi:hypothetical protein